MTTVLRKAWVSPLFFIILLLGSARPGIATTVVLPPDDDMIVSARAILTARVLSVSCGLDSRQDHVYTYTTLRVIEVIKGQITWPEITIKEMGGQIADRGTRVFGSPDFIPGERVLVFLDTRADGSLRTHQMFLGKFSIVRDPDTGQTVVTRGISELGADVLPQSSGQPITNRMALRPYLKMLRSRLAANLDKAGEFESKYYGGVPLLAAPPEYDGQAAGGRIQPEFHLFNPPARWFQPDTAQPVMVITNPDQAPNPQIVNDVAAAMAAWSTVSGCSLTVASGGTTSSCETSNATVVDFNNCLGFFSASSTCQGILAEGGFNYGGAQKTVNGTTFYQISSGFISFNPFASCYFGDHCNVQEITTHEMGHSLGLHHSWDPSFGGSPSASDLAATMYYIAHFDGRCASLRTDDMNGITFVYPGSAQPSYVGFLDTSTCSTLQGWAADRNRLNTSINVEIYDGTALLMTAMASNPRTDVGSYLGDNGLHGFSIATPAALKDGNPHTVHLKFETSTTDLNNSPSTITCGTTNYIGYSDIVGCNTIQGWAADKNRPNTSINVEVYDGGTLLTTVLASNSRPDVGAFLSDNGLHGFSIATPAALKDGALHAVHVKFETSTTDLINSPANLTCTGSIAYIGWVDHIGCDTIQGWAADRSRPNTSINVEVYNGTTLVMTVLASNSRPDVGAYLGDSGMHGFSVAFPASLKDGSLHSIHVKFEASSTELSNSPASLTCH